MRERSLRCVLRALLASAALAVVLAPSALADSFTIQSGNAPLWQPDPNIQIVSVDNTGLAAICAAGNSTGPAWVVAHPAYTVIPGTNYVGFNNTNCWGWPTLGGTGSTVFRTTFTLPAGATGVSLQLSVRADNGFMVDLNGGTLFGTSYAYPNDPCGATFSGGAYPTAPSFTLTTGFVPGVNTLDFTVDNCVTASSTALDFLGMVSYTPAPVLPTAAGQCKKGGWLSFGVFKNQGDCVSYVATKGKNGPNG